MVHEGGVKKIQKTWFMDDPLNGKSESLGVIAHHQTKDQYC